MTVERIEPLRLERLPDVCARVAVKKSTLYRWISEKKFPAPVRIGENSVAWDSRAVDRWIGERVAASRGAAVNRPGSPDSAWTDPLHLASMAIDDAHGHLRDYADSTDDPEPEAVTAADCVEAIMELLARIERKVDLLPGVANGRAAAPLYGGSGAIGGSDGRR